MYPADEYSHGISFQNHGIFSVLKKGQGNPPFLPPSSGALAIGITSK